MKSKKRKRKRLLMRSFCRPRWIHLNPVVWDAWLVLLEPETYERHIGARFGLHLHKARRRHFPILLVMVFGKPGDEEIQLTFEVLRDNKTLQDRWKGQRKYVLYNEQSLQSTYSKSCDYAKAKHERIFQPFLESWLWRKWSQNGRLLKKSWL